MGLFSKLKRQLLKVIEYKDTSENVLAHRYELTDRAEIMNGCQLIVREGQSAILVSEGQIADVFGPGRHKLETKNIPILSSLKGWAYGFDSPFKADVYFINTNIFLNQKWGTSNPVMMRDKEFGVVRLRGYGKFTYRITDPKVFLKDILGAKKSLDTEYLKDQFRSLIVSGFSDALAESKISALDLAANYNEFGEFLTQSVTKKFQTYGITVNEVLIENISLPEEVEKMLDTKTQVGMMKDDMNAFVQFQSAQAIRDAAKNEGGAAGIGVGMGAGIGLGKMFQEGISNSLSNNNNNNNNTNTNTNNNSIEGIFCPKCGTKNPKDAKFCYKCGNDLSKLN